MNGFLKTQLSEYSRRNKNGNILEARSIQIGIRRDVAKEMRTLSESTPAALVPHFPHSLERTRMEEKVPLRGSNTSHSIGMAFHDTRAPFKTRFVYNTDDPCRRNVYVARLSLRFVLHYPAALSKKNMTHVALRGRGTISAHNCFPATGMFSSNSKFFAGVKQARPRPRVCSPVALCLATLTQTGGSIDRHGYMAFLILAK